MDKFCKIIISSLLSISLLSCSQSIENAQVFIATNDLQIGSNRFTFALADKDGLVNSESIEVSFNGDGGYPKSLKVSTLLNFLIIIILSLEMAFILKLLNLKKVELGN